jgi:hypothetical protein
MFAHPINHPLNWFPYDVAGSLELLNTYVSDIERQVEKGVLDFEKNAQESVVEGTYPEEPPRVITTHLGLNDETWDLQTIFREHFPSLQRRSALITLFSFFEHELNELCVQFRKTEKYKLGLRDVSGTGIERARTYLSKVAALELDPSSVSWNEVKNVQALRHLFVHADGRFPDGSEQERGGLRQYVEASKYLSVGTEVVVGGGYLNHVLAAFEEYFGQVHLAIRRRYDA